MDIILVSRRLSKTRSLTVTQTQVVLFAIVALSLMFMFTSWLYSLLPHPAGQRNRGAVVVEQHATSDSPAYVAASLNALASRLGEMQAQLLRLESFGARLGRLVGVKPQEFNFGEKPGRGGPLQSAPPAGDVSLDQLGREITTLSQTIEEHKQMFGVLDGLIRDQRLASKILPTEAPVAEGYHSSDFGMRRDPFTGRQAFHSGIDFVAGYGTPFVAAAAGVVLLAERHPEYGHASKLLVKVGEVVFKGQPIGLIGSTGRSTGTHLHFEVRQGEDFIDPKTFLDLDA